MKFKKNPESGDPSSVHQSFEKMELNVHCCRYWWMKRWHHKRLSYPYWRLYWNKIPGALVYYNTKVMLDPDKIALIPPHTAFSTYYEADNCSGHDDYCMEGGWIQSPEKEREAIAKGYLPHFFIHFNLGHSFDNVIPEIYQLRANQEHMKSIERITGFLKLGEKIFGFRESMEIYSLIHSAIKEIPAEAWDSSIVALRVLEIMNYIKRHLHEPVSNEDLARIVKMAPNSFIRLFKQQTGFSPQSYVRKVRIENACRLLHHSELTINSIAEECGFSDRYYFSKVFSHTVHVSPALYRRNIRFN